MSPFPLKETAFKWSNKAVMTGISIDSETLIDGYIRLKIDDEILINHDIVGIISCYYSEEDYVHFFVHSEKERSNQDHWMVNVKDIIVEYNA